MRLKISAIKSCKEQTWISIDPLVYLFIAFLLLTLPIRWLLAAFCAAVFHEMCHIMALYFFGGNIRGMRIGISGAVIETELVDNSMELVCALAGPLGSFLLLSLYRFFPKLAICACVQGIFNLLPIYPLDGGRVLRCCLEFFWPRKAEKMQFYIEVFIFLGMAIAAALGTFIYSLGAIPLVLSLTLILKTILRKRP